VLYLLPDATGGLPQAKLARLLDREMCRTGKPFVFAEPDGRVTGYATPEWADAAGGQFALEHFVTATAIHLVEGRNRRPAALRAIAGFGMGGFGSASIGLRHPTLYTQLASFGGWFRLDDPAGVFGGEAAHAPDQLVSSTAVRRDRLFLVEGTAEATMLGTGPVRGEADRIAVLARQAGLTVDVRHPAGGHNLRTWFRQLPGAVRFFDRGWVRTTR